MLKDVLVYHIQNNEQYIRKTGIMPNFPMFTIDYGITSLKTTIKNAR